MCVFLCANPSVSTWLDIVVARAERQALQLSALCPDDPYEAPDDEAGGEVDTAARQTVAVRRATMSHVHWNRAEYGRLRYGAASAPELYHPLEALAQAWTRLLLLVGWRR